MKKSILLIGLVLLCSFVIATECQDETDASAIPCDVVTPVLNCTNTTYNVTNTATNVIEQEGNLTAIGDGTYKFTFTQSYGTYNIFLCEDSSFWGTLTVGDFDDETNYAYWAVIFLFLFGWVFIVVGIWSEIDTFSIVGGIIILIVGLYSFMHGLLSINNWMTQWFSIINMLVGAYIVILWTYRQYENM